jgi:bifunctional non-homologous end joining protein LigD
MTPTIQSASLHFREGSSDKEYHAAIEPHGEGYIVTFAYGRRGSTLTAGSKTNHPVSFQEATKVFDKLVASKLAKGYQLSSASAGEGKAPYRQSGNEGRDSGIRCQLLNPVEESELPRLLADTRHCLQEKFDGRRLLVRKQGGKVTGINRRGLIVSLPEPVAAAARAFPVDALIDGEAIGDTLHAFDLLEVQGHDLRQRHYLDRYAGLLRLRDPEGAIRPVATMIEPDDKRAKFQTFRQTGAEGVVFKNIDAAFSPGRPNSGGTQLKFKFVETASFVVTGYNAKRSVTLGLYGGGNDGNGGEGEGAKLVPAGNVTIPPNHAIPQMGTVCEARYLHA